MNRLDEDYWCEGQLPLFDPMSDLEIILSRATREDTPATLEIPALEGPQDPDQQLWDEPDARTPVRTARTPVVAPNSEIGS
jgi:hypothetical protein